VNITIQVDTKSQADLAESRDFLDQLLAGGGRGESPSRAEAEQESEGASLISDPAQQAVDDLWNRVGPDGRNLVITAAAIDGRFTLTDVAKVLDEDVSTIVSRFANLGRSLKRIKEQVPAAPDFFVEAQKTAEGWTFLMPQSIRDAVTQKAHEETDGSESTAA
jgi:hypothetical protein